MSGYVIGVDIGTTRKAAAAAVLSPSLAIEAFIEGEGPEDKQDFGRAVATEAARLGASVIVELQHLQFGSTAIKLIEARMWVMVRCHDLGVPCEGVWPSSWQSRILKLSTIEVVKACKATGTKANKRTKERAREVASWLWPSIKMTEHQIDAALMAVFKMRPSLQREPRST